ncbi:purine-nucleoside phosphorylase [Chitinophagaceae bacterium IBVUCB2]|nr:purine-nucleoside phosphorylase [Chitinophagaceae bacterium IBVUCB2]
MSVHISAKKGEIAPVVLMPGDPLRAKYMADNFLQDAKLVSQTRNILYYTGNYKDKAITIGASGMGCPSIGIYSYELYNEYNVECIVRIGTCGAYTTGLRLFDLINVERAFSESTYALHAFGYKSDHLYHEGNAYAAINDAAATLGLKMQAGAIHSSDVFYRSEEGIPDIAYKNDCVAVEMEAFALFANAKYLKKSAATLLTVSDIIPTHEQISADEREKALLPMMQLALESAMRI